MTVPELSRPISAERPPPGFTVTATPQECEALARRLGIPSVASLSCSFVLRARGRRVEADGELEAHVTQECVVTLDPVAQQVRERFRVRFVPEGEEAEDDDPASPDELPYAGGRIDLGEAAAEQLALALDPYPRDPAATMDGDEDADAGLEGPEDGNGAEAAVNPWAGLRRPSGPG